MFHFLNYKVHLIFFLPKVLRWQKSRLSWTATAKHTMVAQGFWDLCPERWSRVHLHSRRNTWRYRWPPPANSVLLWPWSWVQVSRGTEYCNQKLRFSRFLPVCLFHRPFNTKDVLERSKNVVETQYSVVGVLEDMTTTLAVFEKYIPRFFAGATEIYFNDMAEFKKINKNNFKPPVTEEVKQLLRQNFSREIDFYKFCKQRLQTQFLATNRLGFKWKRVLKFEKLLSQCKSLQNFRLFVVFVKVNSKKSHYQSF